MRGRIESTRLRPCAAAIRRANVRVLTMRTHQADMRKDPPLERIRLLDAPTGPKWHIDLHGYRPREIIGVCFAAILQQAWETGADRIRFIHGHGRARGKTPGFVNTKTGYFGLRIRRQLRHNRALRQWIKYTTLDCGDWGATTVGLKTNASPTRTKIDPQVLPESSHTS